VYDAVAQDPSFFGFLSQIDAELAAEIGGAGCQRCSGRLHTADFPRKPRGCPAAVIEEYSRRLSFTCGRCDAPATPPSVRFLGRRVYVAVVLMLSSPPASASAGQLQCLLGISRRTVLRWRRARVALQHRSSSAGGPGSVSASRALPVTRTGDPSRQRSQGESLPAMARNGRPTHSVAQTTTAAGGSADLRQSLWRALGRCRRTLQAQKLCSARREGYADAYSKTCDTAYVQTLNGGCHGCRRCGHHGHPKSPWTRVMSG